MGHREKNWIDHYQGPNLLFYRRYVDDTFCLFNNETDANLYFNYLNTRHNNIKFTMEKEKDEKLPFLDVLIENSDPKSIHTSVYRKKTFSGLLTNYFSFCSFVYKIGLIRTLVDRIYKINSTWLGFHRDIKKLTFILRNNCYPFNIIEKVTKQYLAKVYTTDLASNQSFQGINDSEPT